MLIKNEPLIKSIQFFNQFFFFFRKNINNIWAWKHFNKNEQIYNSKISSHFQWKTLISRLVDSAFVCNTLVSP